MTKGADSELPGWPKERRPNCPSSPKRGTLEQAWVASVHKGKRAQRPQCAKRGDSRTLASRRHWLLQVVAATAGVFAIVSYRFPSSSSRLRKQFPLMAKLPGRVIQELRDSDGSVSRRSDQVCAPVSPEISPDINLELLRCLWLLTERCAHRLVCSTLSPTVTHHKRRVAQHAVCHVSVSHLLGAAVSQKQRVVAGWARFCTLLVPRRSLPSLMGSSWPSCPSSLSSLVIGRIQWWLRQRMMDTTRDLGQLVTIPSTFPLTVVPVVLSSRAWLHFVFWVDFSEAVGAKRFRNAEVLFMSGFTGTGAAAFTTLLSRAT